MARVQAIRGQKNSLHGISSNALDIAQGIRLNRCRGSPGFGQWRELAAKVTGPPEK